MCANNCLQCDSQSNCLKCLDSTDVINNGICSKNYTQLI